MKNSRSMQKPSLAFSCPADWSSMSACEQGRFCSSCQKTVVDFTKKNEAEIQAFLGQQEGRVCGRFYPHQLAQPVSSSSVFRRILSSVLMLVGLNFLSKEAGAQQQKLPEKLPDKVNPGEQEIYKIGKLREKPKSKPKTSSKKSTVRSMPNTFLTGEVIVNPGFTTTPPESFVNTLKSELEPKPGVYYRTPDLPEIYTFVETRPEYKNGGEAGLKKFLDANRKIVQDNAAGLVVLSFVVDTAGQVSDFNVIKSLSPLFDQEAIRLAKLLEFHPGMMYGKKVYVRYNLPIRFTKP